MKELLDELYERYEYLQTLKDTPANVGKITELQKVMLRIQEIILDEL